MLSSQIPHLTQCFILWWTPSGEAGDERREYYYFVIYKSYILAKYLFQNRKKGEGREILKMIYGGHIWSCVFL